MSSIQPLVLSSDPMDHMDEANSFNMSILIGLLIITITVLIIVSIIMNVWIKSRKSKVMPFIIEKKSSTVPIKQLTPPTLVFNKDTTLPVYRKTDTWDEYLKMIQSPDKLNDVVRTMKVSSSSSSSICSDDNTSDNRKISYENNNNIRNHTLQRESIPLRNLDDYYFI